MENIKKWEMKKKMGNIKNWKIKEKWKMKGFEITRENYLK